LNDTKAKGQSEDWPKYLFLLQFLGRGGGIRTRDPLHPINVKRRISRSHRAPPNLNTTLFTNNYLV